jgi:hypothetical protein
VKRFGTALFVMAAVGIAVVAMLVIGLLRY